MTDDRSQADRILVAKLTGEARFRARWRELTESEESAAVRELQALAAGRTDLLAEVAGVLEGASVGELDEALARGAARLCRIAGADPEAIPAWAEEGRRRSAAARRPPFSGGMGLSRPVVRYLAAYGATLCRQAHQHIPGQPGRTVHEIIHDIARIVSLSVPRPE